MEQDPNPPKHVSDAEWTRVKNELHTYRGRTDRRRLAAAGIADAMGAIQKDYSHSPTSVAVNSNKVATRFAVGQGAFMQLPPGEDQRHPNLFASINRLKAEADDVDAALISALHTIRMLSNKSSMDQPDAFKVSTVNSGIMLAFVCAFLSVISVCASTCVRPTLN